MKARPAITMALAGLTLSLTGCGLRLVVVHAEIDPQDIVAINPANPALQEEEDGENSIRTAPQVSASADQVALSYDGFLWSLTKMPFVAADEAAGERDLVLIDTGLAGSPGVTLDVVARRRAPVSLGDQAIAHVDALFLSGLTLRDLPAVIEVETWEYRLLGVPVYRLSGWVICIPPLEQVRYLCFDNVGAEVTFGVTSSFEPDPAWQWAEFPLSYPDGRPWATLPVGGQDLEILVDSAGGTNLILSPAHWALIADKVKVLKHREGRVPTWGGFEPIDRYKVEALTLGPIVLRETWVWVRAGPDAEARPSVIGLGPLHDTVVVFDFEHARLLVRADAAVSASPDR